MTPIPAVVTVDTSEDVETALRRCISSGHTRLLVTEDENQDRVRGIVHSNTLARQLMAEGPHADDRAARPRRPDRARDQAARRPARRPPAPALLDGRRDRRVRPRRRDRDGRGHRRGGRGRDRRRDRPGGRRGPPAGERRLVRARPRRRDRPARLRARAARRHRRLQLGRRLRLRRAGQIAQARRHDHGQRLLDPRRVRAREPHRGGADPRAPRGVPAARPSPTGRAPTRPDSRTGAESPQVSARACVGARQTSSWGGGVTRRRWDAAGVTRERWIGVVHHQAGRPVRARRAGRLVRVRRGPALRQYDRPARGGPVVCFWEEVHLRGTFAGQIVARFLKRP